MPKNTFGFSLIEVLISMTIIAILGIGIVGMFQFALQVLSISKGRNGAIALANEKVEAVRNLPYEDVGTVGGTPAGQLLQSEIITRNSIDYTVETQIIYIDDPFDGLTPSDTTPNDYKQFKVSVSYNTPLGAQSIHTISNISPRGLETCIGGGALRLTVFDATGEPVDGASVRVVNDAVNPAIDTTQVTGTDGVVLLACTTESQDSYEVTVTKSGFSSDYTCAANPSGSDCTLGNPVPTKPHASVVVASLTEVSFAIDQLATFDISTVNQVTPTEWTVSTETLDDQLHGTMAVCLNSNAIVFGWQDFIEGEGKINGQKYDVTSQSVQWPADIPVSTASKSDNVDVAVDNNCNSYFVWQDERNGNLDVHIEKYDTNGVELLGSANQLETESNNRDQTQPVVAVDNSPSTMYIAWEDDRDSLTDIFLQRLDLDTNEQWAPEIKVNTNSGPGSGQGLQELPSMAININNNVVVVWQDDRNGDYDIYGEQITQNGDLVWGSNIQLSSENPNGHQTNPQIVKDSSPQSFYLVWQDARNGNEDIYLQKFDSNGVRQWTSDLPVNSNADLTDQEKPAVAVDTTGLVYVVWQDLRNGNYDIYAQIIDSAGNKLLEVDYPVAVRSGNQNEPDAAITANDLLAITWQDDAGGDWDLKAAIIFGDATNVATVPNVPLRIYGAKQIGNSPEIYKSDQNVTTDGSGKLLLNTLEWDTYTIEPQSGSGYTLLASDPVVPIDLSPNSTIQVILNVE